MAAPVTAASSLVGRTRELGMIDAALREARTGARWVALTGVAGIGKSRLAEEAVTRWQEGGGRVVRAGCPDDEGVPPWWPLRRVLTELGADPATILATPDGIDADTARFAAYDGIRGVVDAAAQQQPLMLFIDDVHWADPTSLRFLVHVAESPRQPGLVVLITARDNTGGPLVGRLLAAVARQAGGLHVALPPLSPGEVADLAGQIAGEDLAPAAARELAERTGGNPFFVSEYARLPAEERAGGEIPVAVRSVLGRRLAGLDPAVLQVLRNAAVIGEVLDVELLCTVTRLDREELADLLDEAADEHIIVPAPGSGTYTFAHALLRDEIVAGISALRRQRMHLRIAQAVGAGGDTDRLARRASHLVAALPLADAADTFDACRAAALAAEERWHSDAAARWWGAAVEAAELLPAESGVDRDELVIAQMAALSRAGRGQTVLDVLDSALLEAVRSGNLESTGRLAATLLRSSGAWPWVTYGSDPGPVLARLAGIESLVRSAPAAHARVLAALAVGSCYDPDPNVPDTLSQRALDIADELGDPDVVADALLGRSLTFSGVAERAPELLVLLERLRTTPHRTEQFDDVLRHNLLALATFVLGDVAASEQHTRLGAAGSDLLRLPVSRVQLRWAEGTHALWHGDLERAERIHAHAYENHRQTELYESGVFGLALLTSIWTRGLLPEFAGDLLATSTSRTRPWIEAFAAAERGDPAADDLLRKEIERVEPPVWTTHARLTMLAHAVVDAGLRHHVAALRPRLEPLAGYVANIGQVGVAGPVALGLARLCLLDEDLDAAERHLATARELATRTDGLPALVWVRLTAHDLARARGEESDVAELLAIADEAERLSMPGVAVLARRLAEGTG